MNLDFSFVTAEFLNDYIWQGLKFSLLLTLVAMVGGGLLGTLLALARLSGKRWLALPAQVYVDTLRSIPLLMVILWVFLLAPLLIGQPIGAEWSAVITFTLFEAAYYSEIMRAGISSVPQGQVHAGQAVGLRYPQVMRLIVLPQAFRNMLPVLLTQTIVLFQDTSLVYAISAYDLMRGFEVGGKNLHRTVETYLLAAATYFAICFTLSMGVRALQRRIQIIR